MAWADIDGLADFLGTPQDARMSDCLDATLALANRLRPDLDPDGIVGADITYACLSYAGQLYRERSTPQGFASYDAMGGVGVDVSTAYARFADMIGRRKPVAR
jgi:hypothetical protein